MESAATLLPQDKCDTDKVQRLFSLDRSEVKPYFPELLTWLQDLNWPVAAPIADYFALGGDDTVAPIRDVLKGTDRVWQFGTIVAVIERWPTAHIASLRQELEGLVGYGPHDETDVVALRVLAKHRLSSLKFLKHWVQFKHAYAQRMMEDLEIIEQVVNGDG